MRHSFILTATCVWLVGNVLAATNPTRGKHGLARPPWLTQSTPVTNHYIVQYHDHVDDITRRKHEALMHSATARHNRYRGVMKKFTIGSFKAAHVEMDAASAAEFAKSSDLVSFSSDGALIL